MTTITVNNQRMGAGRLAYNVSDLSAAWPHGGTQLGLVRSAEVRFGSFLRLTQEETNSPSDVIFLGDQLELRVMSSGWDSSARAVIFPNLSSNNPIFPGSTIRPGGKLSAIVNLLFAPFDTAAPAVLLRAARAIPNPGIPLGPRGGGSTLIRGTTKKYLDIEVAFVGCPDGSDNVGIVAPIASISL